MTQHPSTSPGTVLDSSQPVRRPRAELWIPFAVFGMFLCVWQLVVTVWSISPVLFPGPLEVAAALWKIRTDLFVAVCRTAFAAFCGLSISIVLGTLIAFAFSQSSAIRRAFYPYAVLLQTVPIIAIAPVVIVTLGRGFLSISLVASILSLFPIITSTTTGLLQVDASLLDLFRLNRATRLQTLLRLRVPSALPYLISGIRISSGSAIVGAIVGEFFVGSGTPGLGALIQRKSASLNMSELYATVFVSTLLGTFVFAGITALGEAILSRWFGMSLNERGR